MNKAIFKNGKLIGMAMAMVLTISAIGVYSASAADRIDSTKELKVTVEVPSQDDSIFATEYTGTVEVELYKIAAMDDTGKLTKVEPFNTEDIDISVMNGGPSVAQVNEKIVDPALEIAKSDQVNPNKTITLDMSQAKTATVKLDAPGLYLYIPKDAANSRYTFSFTSYVITAPTSTFIMTGSGDDTWTYESKFGLKSEATPRSGDLKITKTLETFNSSLGTASFVYKVVAVLDEEEVLNNVYSLDFDSAGTKERIIKGLPADAVVTVTEVYTGASYDIVGNDEITKTIIADEAVEATFKNDYDGRLIQGGISAENEFEEVDGVIYWIDKEGNSVQQTSPPVLMK